MKNTLQNQVEHLNRQHRSNQKQKRLRTVLGAGAAAAVLYALLLPAFTLEKPTYCGLEEHTHSDECYEYVLDCPVTKETGAVLTAEEFKKLPGAAEAEALFEREAKAEKEAAEDLIEETKAPKAAEKDDEVVSKAEEPSRDEKQATSSNYPTESSVDVYVSHERAGAAVDAGTESSDTEETTGYAVANSDGAVEGTPEETGLIIASEEEDPEVITANEEDGAAGPGSETGLEVNAGENEENVTNVDTDTEDTDTEIEDHVDTETGLTDAQSGDQNVAEEGVISDASEDVQAVTEGDGEVIADTTTEGAPAASEVTALTTEEEPQETAAAELAGTHVHTAACYKRVLICGMEEHEHGLSCFVDKDADIEDLTDLEALFPTFEDEKVKDSYEYAAKLAEFQKGYRESVKNYEVIDDGEKETTQGYTRYGDWAGDAYHADWSPLFAAFTAEFSGQDIQSYDKDVKLTADEWMQALRDVDPALYPEDAFDESLLASADQDGHISLVRDVEGYIDLNYADYLEEDEEGNEYLSDIYYEEGHPAAPSVGELVFLDLDSADGDFVVDHVGIITAVNLKNNRMTVMVGDDEDRVKEEKFHFDDMPVLGYARLPETEEAIRRNIEVNGEPESVVELEDFGEIELESEADEEETAESEVELEIAYLDDVVTVPGPDYTVSLTIGKDAKIPDWAEINVTEIEEGTPEYKQYEEEARKAAGGENAKIKFARFFDISITIDGEEIEPAQPVAVEISYDESVKIPEDGVKKAVHFTNSGDIEIIGVAADETADAEAIAEYEEEYTAAEAGVEAAAPETAEAVSGTVEVKTADFASDEAFATAQSNTDEPGLIGGIKKLGRGLRKLLVKDTLDLESQMGVTEPVEENTEAITTEDKTTDAAAEAAASDQHIKNQRKPNRKPAKAHAHHKSDRHTFSFVQDSFSVTGTVIYTVDVAYENNRWSFPGQGSYAVSDILVRLGIEDTINSVELELVEGEDVEGALYLTSENGEYYLNSDVPFTSTYVLSVVSDEVTYLITVTDLAYTSSLNNVLTGLVISGAEWNGSQYVVKPGKTYDISMTFQEGEGQGEYQFLNDGWMTLSLPDGITFIGQGEFDIVVNEAGENFTIHGNDFVQDGNSIKIRFDTGDKNYQKLKDLTTAKFNIHVQGTFDSKHSEYHIESKTDSDIKVDSTPDVNVTKGATLTDWNGSDTHATVKYTLTVTSNGEASGVEITDAISGTGLTYNNDAKAYYNGQEVSGWNFTNQSGSGFTCTTGTLEDGKTYTIEYTATIDKSQLVDNEDGTFSVGPKNTVTWPGDHSTTHDLGHVVTKPGISKSAGNVTSEGSMRTIPWTITAYSDYGTNNRLGTVKDTIQSDGMHYSGTGLTVKVYDTVTGQQVGTTSNISWSELNVNSTSTSWELNIAEKIGDNTGKKYRYEISYSTEYNASNLTGNINLNNGYEDDRGNHGTSGTGIGPDARNTFDLEKRMDGKEQSEDGTVITWHLTVSIPAAGLTADQAVLTDVFPHASTDTKSYQDTYVADSFKVISGLGSDGDAVVDATDPSKLVITFKKKNGDLGLPATFDGQQRIVEIELKTLCDPDWLEDAQGENGPEITHVNTANFNNIYRSASYTPDTPIFNKSGSRDGMTEDGLPKFKYDLMLGVISEELFNGTTKFEGVTIHEDNNGKYIELTDTFDSRLSYIAGSTKIYGGGDRYYQGSGETSLIPEYDENAHTVTFKLYQNDLPKNGSSLYPFYRVHYELQVKDKETFDTLQQDAITAEGHKITLGNSVTGFGHKEHTIDYTPRILDKAHHVEEGNKLIFTLTVNEDELKLSDDGVLILTDTMTNLSVRYQDVTIEVEGGKTVETTDAAGNPVTAPYFNMKGDTITFYLPDEVKTTITYRATPRGTVSSDGKIYYSNKANLQGFEKTDSGSQDYQSDASGYGTNYGVYLYKGDGYVNSKPLPGAVFKLFVATELDKDGNVISGTPVKNADGTDHTVTTSDGRDGSDPGTVLVMGTDELGWNLKPETRYYLQEVKAPEGYALDNTKYSFLISKDGYVNYTRYPALAPDGSGKIVPPWTYYNGDIMTVKDWPEEGLLTLKKSFVGTTPEQLDEARKAALTYNIYKLKREASGEEPAEYELIKTVSFNQFTQNAEGEYTYTLNDLQEGTYKVEEIVDDVTCKSTVYAVTESDDQVDEGGNYATVVVSEEDISNSTEHQVNITNTYDIPSEFKIYKHAEGETSYRIAGATFGVYDVIGGTISESALETYVTNSLGRFTVLLGDNDDESHRNFEPDHIYALKETVPPEGFKLNESVIYFCFLNEGETEIPQNLNAPEGTVAIAFKSSVEQSVSDTPDTTFLEAGKVWLNEEMVEDTTKNTPVTVRIKQTAYYDKAHTVMEPELSGYYTATGNKPVDVTKAATYQIEKIDGKWQLTGQGVENGRLDDLPTMIIDRHVPIYYGYEVEEFGPTLNDYTPRYDYDKLTEGEKSGTKATITNRPRSITSTTQLKARKKWVDVNGTDVTDKTALDESVEVDVYRYSGILKRGSILESNGKMKDPSQQFMMSFEDRTGNGTLNTSMVAFLPGDRVRITIKPTGFLNGKKFSDLTSEPNLRSNWDTFKQGADYTHVKDLENEQYVFEFNARSDDNNKDIRIEQFSEVSAFDVTIENINAVGRTQVLTQADLEGIEAENKTWLETLELSTVNGWNAISKEYPVSSKAGVPYSYYIVEKDGSNFQAEYSIAGDIVTVTNVEKKLEIDKKWFAANGTDEITENKIDGSITYTIKRNTYTTPVPAYVNIDYRELNLTYDNGTTVPVNSDNVTIASGIKVGSTIKVQFRLPDDHSNAENSTMDGLDVDGCEQLYDSGPVTVENNGHKHAEREYTFKVTETTLKLSGTLQADRNAAVGLKIDISILKEPSGTYIPGDSDIPTVSDETVGTLTVGCDSIISSSFGEGSDITANVGTTPWSAVISKLPGVNSDNSLTYTYYVEELESDDFTKMDITPATGAPVGGKVVVRNKLKEGALKVEKVVAGAAPEEKEYSIAVRDSEGYYYKEDGSSNGMTPYYVSFKANDVKKWDPLTPGVYTVLERDASESGYAWTVAGTGDIKVKAKVNENDADNAVVTNSYYKITDYSPKVTKALLQSGREAEEAKWPENGFDFYLSADKSNPAGALLNARSATATYSNKTAEFKLVGTAGAPDTAGITFEKPGTYYFNIEEVLPEGIDSENKKDGIIYSSETVKLTVVVEENSNCELVVSSVVYTPSNGKTETSEAGGKITNNIESNNPVYAPSVTKTLSGREWQSGDSFTFRLATAGNYSEDEITSLNEKVVFPEKSTVTVTADSESKKETFGELEFKEAGTYQYSITEIVPEDAVDNVYNSITYDGTPKNLSIMVESVEGALQITKVTIDGTEITGEAIIGSGATVENTYISGSVSFKAKKEYNDTLQGNDFTFKLVETDQNWTPLTGATPQTVKNNASGDVIFESVALTSSGTRYFTIAEVVDENDQTIVYDDHIQKITVTVTENGGQYIATKTYDPDYSVSGYDATFVNTKKKNISIYKVWRDKDDNYIDWPEGTASITLTLKRKRGSGEATDYAVYTVTSNGVTAREGDVAAIWQTGTKTSDSKTFKYYQISVSNLPAKDGNDNLEYWFVESGSAGYMPTYSFDNNSSIVAKTQKTDRAEDGDYIVNKPQDAYALPSTGGHGTAPIRALGLMLMASAVGLGWLTYRRRHVR